MSNIVIGVDYSPSAVAALKEAFRIANWNRSGMAVVHVIDQEAIEAAAERGALDGATTREEIIEEACGRLRTWVGEILGDEFTGAVDAIIGHPFVTLLKVVEDRHADLLVLGSRGSGKSENRTGVLAARCVRKAPVKVLLVRERQDGPFQKVAACIDFSENATRAVEEALRIAEQDRAELHLIHVFQPIVPGLVDVAALAQPISPLLDEDYVKHIKEKMVGLLHSCAGDFSGLEIEAHVIEEIGVGHGIVDALNETGADLVVLGTRGRTGLKAILLGTTAERVIHNAPCSVLAIKPEGFEFKVD